MKYKARVKENQEVILYTEDYFDKYPDLVVGWEILEITLEETSFIQSCRLPKRIEGVFIEGYIEIIHVPKELSTMKFIMQVFISTGIKYENIVEYINEIPIEIIDDYNKYLILTRLDGCTHFERNSEDLLLIATMMGITSEQLDEIFINGNLIQ